MKHRFYKEDSHWYIDLPEWQGLKEELEMVMGADDLLDLLSFGKDEVTLEISIDIMSNPTYILTFYEEYSDGGWYIVNGGDFKVWLCSVTKFIFGNLPNKIYIR